MFKVTRQKKISARASSSSRSNMATNERISALEMLAPKIVKRWLYRAVPILIGSRSGGASREELNG
jgi:hypothetical protein